MNNTQDQDHESSKELAQAVERVNTLFPRTPPSLTSLEYLSPKQFSELTGVPLSTVWSWLRKGQLAHLPKNEGQNLYRIPRSELKAVKTQQFKPRKVLPFTQPVNGDKAA
jgi:excisionase family DNA binding protein